MKRAVVGLALVAIAPACYAPISSAVPGSPVTTGEKSGVGLLGSVEGPAIDTIAAVSEPPSASSPSSYPTAGAPMWRLSGRVGLSSALDAELGFDGGLYGFVIPWPHGGHVGLRHHTARTESFDLGISGRVGATGALAQAEDALYENAKAYAVYGGAALSATYRRWKSFRPGVALSAQPMVMRRWQRKAPRVWGGLGSMTVQAKMGSLVPFASVQLISTTNVRGTSPYVSGGVALEY